MFIMEMQVMEVNILVSEILYSVFFGDLLSINYSFVFNIFINQNVSLYQVFLGGCSQDFLFFSFEVESLFVVSSFMLFLLVFSNFISFNFIFGFINLIGFFFLFQFNGIVNDIVGLELFDFLGGLLDEVMLDEISFMDLVIEEGFNFVQVFQLEEEFDFDLGFFQI